VGGDDRAGVHAGSINFVQFTGKRPRRTAAPATN
jgi:hypothetical protein